MTRSELITRLAAHFSTLLVEDAENSVTLILDAIASAVARGNRVEIRGFGSLVTTSRPRRIGRNPRSGEVVHIPAKRVLRFTPGKDLRARVDFRSS